MPLTPIRRAALQPSAPAALVAAIALIASLLAVPTAGAAEPPTPPTVAASTPSAAQAHAEESPAAFISFVLETTGNCMLNNGQQIQMRSSHPSRKIRVWLDRFQRGIGTGDRSRTDLAPGAEPDPLGCSRSAAGGQEWRIVRAIFVD
jgi:hypothetical protein